MDWKSVCVWVCAQMATFGARMTELGLDDRWLVREGKVVIRRGEIKAIAPLPEKQKGRAGYAVPPDFDASLLGPVTATSQEAAYTSVADVMAERWVIIREQVCMSAWRVL